MVCYCITEYCGFFTYLLVKYIFFSSKTTYLSPEEIAEVEDEYFPMESPYGLFRLCK